MHILFICTGNLCRSTSAEYLSKHLLAERLGCPTDALPSRGWILQSAGTMAIRGQDLPDGVRRALASRGVRPPPHRSQPVTESLVRAASMVVCAAREHHHAIVSTWAWSAPKLRMMDPAGDVADPMGGSMEDYRASLEQVEAGVLRLLDDLAPTAR